MNIDSDTCGNISIDTSGTTLVDTSGIQDNKAVSAYLLAQLAKKKTECLGPRRLLSSSSNISHNHNLNPTLFSTVGLDVSCQFTVHRGLFESMRPSLFRARCGQFAPIPPYIRIMVGQYWPRY